jgi:hypothetical protein
LSGIINRVEGWVNQLRALAGHRWVLWALVGLGILRAVVGLLGYPPAHGADSTAYFLYAEYLGGVHELSGITEVVPILYPLLIRLTYGLFDSIGLLLVIQFVMSVLIAPLYYDALKKIDPLLALGIGLLVVLDFQTSPLFNFVSTEPLYIFLLALAFNLFMRTLAPQGVTAKGLIAAGVVVFLLMSTRAVAQFIIIPLGVVLFIQTRNWRRVGWLVGSFAALLLAYTLLTQVAFSRNESLSNSSYMLSGIVTQNAEWLSGENGAASAEVFALLDSCENNSPGNAPACYIAAYGSTDGMVPLFINAAIETIQANLGPYLQRFWENLNYYLSLSGQQLGFDELVPSAAQCSTLDAQLAATGPEDYTRLAGFWGFYDYIEAHFDDFHAMYAKMKTALCPMYEHSPAARSIVDTISFRYRSLSRPNPMLWYAAVFSLTLLIPLIRKKYLGVVLTSGVFLFNHALISAVITNSQPRYVVVTNPFRAILLTVLIFSLIRLFWWGVRRVTGSNAPADESV